MTYYLIFFMEISTRRVHFVGLTQHPNEEWMMEVANKVSNAESGFLRGKRILLLDRDTKFTLKFREHLESGWYRTDSIATQKSKLQRIHRTFFQKHQNRMLA